MPNPSLEFQKVFQALRRHGLLLESDAWLPSLTHIVAGEPIKGSWWGHPKGRLIFRVSNQIDYHPDVLVTKLISGKVTFVHRKLWPALLAVANAREAWQTRNLSATARALLKLVIENGQVQTDQHSRSRFSKFISPAALELEKRLLVHGEQFHSDSGSHAKRLETWDHWAKRVGVAENLPAADQAKADFEKTVTLLNERWQGKGQLPWCDAH